MPQISRFYPGRAGDQIVWLGNYRNKIGGYQIAGSYLIPEINATIADADVLIYLLNTVQIQAQTFAQSITSHLDLMGNGTGNALVPLPTFTLPLIPAPPANVLPGALKRIFAFITNLKTRAFYTEDIGANLQIVSSTTANDPNAVPSASAEARSNEVALTFKKSGHMGVYIETQTGDASKWTFLAISTGSPYHDTRPLSVDGQPEKRRYRLCFWDGTPTNVWTDAMEVTFGG